MARRITVGWEHPDTEEAFRVTLDYYPGSPGGLHSPPEAPEVDVVSVKEDRAGGQNRPDLVPLVEADLDRLREAAEGRLQAEAEVASDLAFDAAREDRMFGRGR